MNAIAQASAAPITGPKLDNRRVLAAVVDLAIIVAGAMVVLFAADALSGDRSEVQGALSAVILGWTLYYYFALESGGGQTVGKKLMKLRVVRADGRPAGMREIAVRTVLRVVDGVGGYIVGLIVMLGTGQRRQRLGDLAAGTIVVDASAPASAPHPPPLSVEPVEEAPEVEAAASGLDTATISLPSRPAPPATVADLAAPEAPAVPELRPFDPPSAEPAEPFTEDEPLLDAEPVLDEEPLLDAEPVQEEEPLLEEEPVLDFEPLLEEEPVVEEDPVVENPLAEFQPETALEPEPETHTEPEPEVAVEPEVEAAELSDQPFPLPEADDEEFTVKSVETISAIDLVMGGAPEEEPSSEQAQDPDEPVSQ